jgi:death on curing protein
MRRSQSNELNRGSHGSARQPRASTPSSKGSRCHGAGTVAPCANRSHDAWRWLNEREVIALHDAQFAAQGGRSGVRDVGLLQRAVARPRRLAAFATPDIFELAAAYAHAITQHHPFVDGNKRTAFAAAAAFLRAHGDEIRVAESEKVQIMLDLSARRMSEPDFTTWLRAHTVPVEDEP